MAKTYNIALIGGDGTGPEVAREGVKVLQAAAAKFGFKVNFHPYDFGAERYLRTGETLPDSAVEEMKKYNSIFLGAIGHPDVKPGILELGILLKMRFALDLGRLVEAGVLLVKAERQSRAEDAAELRAHRESVWAEVSLLLDDLEDGVPSAAPGSRPAQA